MILCIVCVGNAVVSVMDSHLCDRGSNPSQGKSHDIDLQYALNNIHFTPDESFEVTVVILTKMLCRMLSYASRIYISKMSTQDIHPKCPHKMHVMS